MQYQSRQKAVFSLINKCRLCGSDQLVDILDLGDQPPANSLKKSQAEEEKTIPLKVVLCKDCSVAQLTATVDPQYLFNEYLWVTGTSSGAKNYSQIYCQEVLKRCAVEKPFVVEVASNDGTFLEQFINRGCDVLGVDPAQNITQIANKKGIPTKTAFFDHDIANKIIQNKSKAHIVMARNVIPHVKEIHSIVNGISKLVDDNGIAVIEFHYAKKIIEELHYDSVYHEHLFYFSIRSISKLFEQYGLIPFDVLLSPISGGSLVLFFSKQRKNQSKELLNKILDENTTNLNSYDSWSDFGNKSISHALELKNIVEKYAANAPLAAYGASARSSTLLNFCKITNKEIQFVIDRNPLKKDFFTPGTSIPIISYEDGVEKLSGKNLILLAWNFEEEIISDLRSIGYKGKIIVPLPNKIQVR